MKKKWYVQLSNQEISQLEEIVKKGKSSARTIRRAQTLLLVNEGKSDEYISNILRCCSLTVYETRKRYYEEGLKAVLIDKARKGRPAKIQGKAKARLIAMACEEPPEGRSCWTMQLLAERLITLQLIDSISDDTVGRTLKKMTLNLGK
jgi:transposase